MPGISKQLRHRNTLPLKNISIMRLIDVHCKKKKRKHNTEKYSNPTTL